MQLALGLFIGGPRLLAAGPAVPVNLSMPVISGSATNLSTITTTNGSWTNSPTSYTYKWFSGSTEIIGQTANTFVNDGTYQDTDLTSQVTAINAEGSSTPSSSNVIRLLSFRRLARAGDYRIRSTGDYRITQS